METNLQKLTKRTDADYENYISDESGVHYSPDGKRLLHARIDYEEVYSIREGTEVICDRAFDRKYYNFLKKIVIPESVKVIGENAFDGYYGVEVVCHSPHFVLQDNLLIDNDTHVIVAFFGSKYDDIVIPESVKSVGRAFWNSAILQITLSKSIKSIGKESFQFCSMLQKVTIPDSVTSIGDNAFDECEVLRKIDIPKSVETIGKEAFMWCAFKELVIPNGVESIGDGAFTCCGLMERITIPNSLTHIGSNPFAGCDKVRIISHSKRFMAENDMLIDNRDGRLITYFGNAEQLYVPNTVYSIGSNAFADKPIKQITLPSTVKNIEKDAFVEYNRLEKIIICGSNAKELKAMLPEKQQKITECVD